MGISSSKQDHNTALLLCKDRVRSVKRAIDARYALSAAQLTYLQSLRNVGQALRQFVEAEMSTGPLQSPSHSSYASPSPSPSPLTVTDPSPLLNGTPNPYEKNDGVNYMRTSGAVPMQLSTNLNETCFMKEEDSSWDFFDPTGTDPTPGKSSTNNRDSISPIDEETELEFSTPIGKAEAVANVRHGIENVKGEIGKEDDACQFITHRAKDMAASIREIEHQFMKAAESGHEVSRMLETKKIRLTVSSQAIGKAPPFVVLLPCLICCKADNSAGNESEQQLAKVITWNRSVSSQSSSSRNPLISQSKEDTTESGSDFIEEFSMISGSHSSTLDRLYAWERKLYDELKAIESLGKAYDQKRTQLRHQFARDFDKRVIDKTRAIVKDLHSRLMVAIQAVDFISRKIEKLRDEELQPQLVEFVHGLTRMWKAMLETYHAQQITISLAYHTAKDSSSPTTTETQNELQKQALVHLRTEIDCLQLAFSNWVKHHRLYVESLNSWLQNCILQPQERPRGKRITFSPRRALAPPIFVLIRDWSNGCVATLSEEALDSMKSLSSELNVASRHNPQEAEKGEVESKLGVMQMCLVRTFEQMRKFSESLIKVYENAKEESERAKNAYVDGAR